MATQSMIRWSRGDYVKLGRAVANFNKKKRELETEENSLYLPATINYQEIKETIKTRSEFNRVINSLRRVNNANAFDIVENSAGQKMTRWQYNENIIQKRNATRAINQRIKELETPKKEWGGLSRAEMGSKEYRKLQGTLKSFENIDKVKGYDYKMIKERINFYAQSDLKMKRAIVYRENYIKEMEKYSLFDNYDKFMNTLKSIKNPLDFFEFVSKTDFTVDLTYQSEQYYTQEAFNSYLQDLGIEIEVDSISK